MSDAETLKNAMKGFGTDEDAIIKIVANRSNRQRQQIKEDYLSKYNSELIKDLKSELSGNFKDAVIALFTDPLEYDCSLLNKAMKGIGTDEDTLIEIIASRPPSILIEVKKKYKELYQKELEEDVKSETSGNLQNLLISLLQCNRSTNEAPSQQACSKIAQEIYNAGESKFGNEESIFNKYFPNLSPRELCTVFQEYYNLSKHTILEEIDKKFSGDTKKALRAIVYATISPSEYFATRVQEALKGIGTNDSLLIRILITQDEIDLPAIKQFYKLLYGKDMIEEIKSETSGDYQKLLVELCSH